MKKILTIISHALKNYLDLWGYFERGSLSGIENMDQGMVVEAKPDSYWNMVILNGFLKWVKSLTQVN